MSDKSQKNGLNTQRSTNKCSSNLKQLGKEKNIQFSINDDESFWGKNIREELPSNLHRIYFQNLDGMKNDSDEIDLFVSSMSSLQVSTVCWADPGLDFSQAFIRKKVNTAFRNHFLRAKIAFSSCQLPSTTDHRGSGYQPGGTLTATTGNWASRTNGIESSDPSGMGRWSGITFLGSHQQKITILTAYRSPRQSSSDGFGFYDQQYAILLSKGVKQPNIRKQFITDIVEFINDLQRQGHQIILSLDANEVINQEQHYGIASLLEDCDLYDLHAQHHTKPPATYKYGHDRRIDFIFCSHQVKKLVSGVGYNQYDNGIHSKHRGIFIDLKLQHLMGKIPLISSLQSRRLNSEDPILVESYIKNLKTYLENHKIIKRVKKLQGTASSISVEKLKREFDIIDNDLTRGMIHAEKKIKRARGKYQWSPKLRAQGMMTRYWRLRMQLIRQPSSRNLSNQMHSLKLRFDSLSIPRIDDETSDYNTIKGRWKESMRELKKVKIIANDYRHIHLASILLQYQDEEAQNNTNDPTLRMELQTKISRVKKLIHTEFLRTPFRALKASISGKSAGSITQILIPQSPINNKVRSRFCNLDGTITESQLLRMAQFDKHSVTYRSIIDPQAMEDELLEYNSKWFQQASSTPFGHGELYDHLGFDGLTSGGEAISSGELPAYSGLKLSPEIEILLEELKQPEFVKSFDCSISNAQYVKEIKKWKERTSTSPSGRHLGHYKAAILDCELTQLHTNMLNLPIAFGFAPQRWCMSVSPLLEKEEGKPYIQRLRVIHLFEADYNLFLKTIFGRRMVSQAETLNLLNDQQHGSRPRRMTTDALFLSRLSKDIFRQSKTNSVHMDNDATGCYDRILISIGMLACKRLGVPNNAIKCQSEALKNMRYSIKHAFGTSKKSYGSSEDQPLFGTGQGSGASPAIWLAVVVALLNSLERLSTMANITGLQLQDPWEEVKEHWRVGAFVDDTNQGISDPTHLLSHEQLIEQLRVTAQQWEHLLSASGGALNLSKCLWSIQTWEWVNGRPKQMNNDATKDLLTLTSGESPELHIIKQVKSDEAIKTLGVWMNAKGTFDTQAKEMTQKFNRMAGKLRSAVTTPCLANVFYNSYFLPSAKYSLPVTSMSCNQLQKIQSRMVMVTLQKMGYNCHYPRAVVFASKLRMGCGFQDLYVEQGLSQLQALLDNIGNRSQVGNVMIISLRTLQVEAGVTFDLLLSPTPHLPYLTECWIGSLRQFCAHFEITVAVSFNRFPSLTRIHDKSIMEVALKSHFSRQELVDINLIRIYLQVTCLSDITSACGKKLHPFIWRGLKIPDRASKFSFPRQVEPSKLQKALWRKLLRHVLHPEATSKNLELLIPLGVWCEPPNQKWGAMMWNNTLYRRDPFLTSHEARYFQVHFPKSIKTNPTKKYYDSTPDWLSCTLPRLASPSDLSGNLIFTANYAEVEYSSIPAPANSLRSWLSQSGLFDSRLLQNLFSAHQTAEQKLIHYLKVHCIIYIGTDGGKQSTRGSFAWIICGPDKQRLMSNFGPVDGWQKCLSSLRSEATAIQSVTLYLTELATYHDINIKSSFQFYVDSTSAISNVQKLKDQIPTRKYTNNCDIFSSLRSEQFLLSRYSLTHVRSHQNIPFDKLPFPAKLNTLCDELASKQLRMQEEGCKDERSKKSIHISASLPIILYHQNNPLTSRYIPILRKQIADVRHQTFLQRKFKWSQETFDSIAWMGIEQCMKKAARKDFVTRSKLAHNWLNLGEQRARFTRDASHSEKCPLCFLTTETFGHLLSCQSPRAKQHRYRAMTHLRTSLKNVPSGNLMILAINHWTADPKLSIANLQMLSSKATPSLTLTSTTIDILQDQEKIGWEIFFRGYLSKKWATLCVTQKLDSESAKDQEIGVLSKCVRALQDYSLSIWKFRSSVLHESESDTSLIVHAKLHQDIANLYKVKEQYSDVIQQYFHKPLEVRLKDSTRSKQRWLILAKLATSHSTAVGSRQQVLTTYWAPPCDSTTVLPRHSPMDTNDIPGAPDSEIVRQPPSQTIYTQTSIREFCTTQSQTHTPL